MQLLITVLLSTNFYPSSKYSIYWLFQHGCQVTRKPRKLQNFKRNVFAKKNIFVNTKRLEYCIRIASLLNKNFQPEMLKSQIYFAHADFKRFAQLKFDFVKITDKIKILIFKCSKPKTPQIFWVKLSKQSQPQMPLVGVFFLIGLMPGRLSPGRPQI